MKPIETFYNGNRFRSRLEARWAVFFNHAGIKYQYELEGFALKDGSSYLPDFYLPDINAYVEIKSIGAFSIEMNEDTNEVSFAHGRERATQYAYFVSEIETDAVCILFFGDPYDVYLKAFGMSSDSRSEGHIFLFGECKGHVLSQEDTAFVCDTDEKCILCHRFNGLMHFPFSGFYDGRLIVGIDTDNAQYFPTRQAGLEIILIQPNQHNTTDSARMTEQLRQQIKAAQEAREARFEHGETPAVK